MRYLGPALVVSLICLMATPVTTNTDESDHITKYQQIESKKEEPIKQEIELIEPASRGKSAEKFLPLKFYGTVYHEGPECCGKLPSDPGYGITATGTKVQEYRTISVDPEVIPLNSWVLIETPSETRWYRAEDVGGGVKGNHIDFYVPKEKITPEKLRDLKTVNVLQITDQEPAVKVVYPEP